MKPGSELFEWIIGDASRALCLERFLDALVARLVDAGCGPFVRVHVGGRTMHPEVFAQATNWTPNGTSRVRFPHGQFTGATIEGSPVGRLLREGTGQIRIRLDGDDGLAYDVTRSLRAQGATDYLLFGLMEGEGKGSVVSFATDLPGGFPDAQVEFLRALVPFLRARVEVTQQDEALAELLRTYLGPNASRRVLSGEFVRGTGERLRAVVWMSDLRDFTGRTDREPVERVLRDLDAYFTAVAEPIGARGGEVLKFIGDAVLGVFPLGDDPAASCSAALQAARDAFERMDATNVERAAAGLDALRFGLALHVGEVMYGNIGTRQRLDFTVIGRPVNEVARVQSLCSKLDAPLLVTGAFARAVGAEAFRALGAFPLRGVAEPVEVYAPVDRAGAPPG